MKELIETKQCSKCGEEYPATTDYFCRRKTGQCGLYGWCKKCMCEHGKIWRKNNPEKQKEYEQTRSHCEKRREYKRLLRKKNLEKIRNYNREWSKKNPERCRKYARNYISKNPSYRISRNISSAVWASLKGGKNGHHWESLVGYTRDDLMGHLESQFIKGMTWANYGEWHVDHVRPISDFDFKSPDDIGFKECWSLWNLQPLWGKENRIKHATCEVSPLPLLVNGGIAIDLEMGRQAEASPLLANQKGARKW